MNGREMRIELLKIKGLGSVMANRIAEHFEEQKLLEPQYKYCYSWDGENYNSALFDYVEDALKDAKQSSPGKEEVHIGAVVRPILRWISNEEEIINSMEGYLMEKCGEYGKDALDITDEMMIALGEMIDQIVEEWIDKYHIKPNCYTILDSRIYRLN